MYLVSLYSEPLDLFPKIDFKDGINLIFGKKDTENDPKESLNGIGKSLALDFIDFCLLSSLSKKNERLYKAKKFLKGYAIILEFEVDGEFYLVKRYPDKPNSDIMFGKNDNLESYSLKELQRILCDLIFKNEYNGYYSKSWFRRLMAFFVKIEKRKEKLYTDPISYLKSTPIREVNQYHLFLMGIDNTLINKNNSIQEYIVGKEKAITEIKGLLRDTYKLDDISAINTEIDALRRQINELVEFTSNFKLEKSYLNAEEQANKLTLQIKNLWYEKYAAKRRIDSYKQSYDLNPNIDSKKISKLYKESNHLLGNNVKKTLDDAINFRKSLSESRKKFLREEIERLEKVINQQEKQIELLENKRASLFNFLANKDAIKDLSEAYLLTSQKKDTTADLESKVRIYNDLTKQKLDLKSQDALLSTQLYSFIDEISDDIAKFRTTFAKIYNSIYVENKDKSIFDLEFIDNTSKLEIKIAFPAMESEGKNRGMSLIYDLSILFNAIDNNINCPRFLIHDGIFDGMDKAHFVQLYTFIEQMKLKKRFQYIVALNEEGTLNEKFGNVEEIHPDKLSKIAILNLTPTKKLIGKDF
ncbi:MAG TPA: hypothetical protein DF637_02605 [Rikenellaceae bacterium]|nr:hypothetical protein [Rikenellaceae bacterium]